jgi:hypothetical protein
MSPEGLVTRVVHLRQAQKLRNRDSYNFCARVYIQPSIQPSSTLLRYRYAGTIEYESKKDYSYHRDHNQLFEYPAYLVS